MTTKKVKEAQSQIETLKLNTPQKNTEATATFQSEANEQEAQKGTEVQTSQPVNEKGGKRVQVSVYLNPESHAVMKSMEDVTKKSVAEMLAMYADTFAEQNAETAKEVEEARKVFDKFSVKW